MEHVIASALRWAGASHHGLRAWGKGAWRAVAVVVAVAILNLGVSAFAITTPPLGVPMKSAIGTLTVDGVIEIDGEIARSGQTLFSGCNIRTSATAGSALDLGNGTRLKLSAETSLRLDSTQLSLAASLESGVLRVVVPKGVRAEIATNDALITTDASQLSVFSVVAESCSTTLSVQAGRVELRTADGMRSVFAGDSFKTVAESSSRQPAKQSFSTGKKIGLFITIRVAVAAVLVAIRGGDQKQEQQFGGCVTVSSISGC